MRLRPRSSFVLSWILAVALTVAPLMAQQPHAPVTTQTPEVQTSEEAQVPQEEATQEAPVVGENGEPVGTPVPVESKATTPESTFPNVEKNSTPLSNPTSSPQPSSSNTPGESKWIILAVLITTAAVVGAVLLFRGFGGGKSSPKSPPVGTVLTPGTPTVNAPR